MKKFIVIALIVLVGGALLVGPLLKSDPDPGSGENPLVEETLPAQFNMTGNMAAICNQGQNLEVAVNEKGIAIIEVVFDGEIIQKWENPTSNVSFSFTPTNVGTYAFDLNVTTSDGKVHRDERALRVVSDFEPKELTAEIVQSYPHNDKSFTQGLEFNEGKLYEGIGLYGESKILEVELETGTILRKLGLDGNYFGEGITLLNDTLYQLTWRKGTCFLYDFKGDNFELLREEMSYIGEGWGLCNNGSELIMSDGTETLYFRDPSNFQETRRIQVYNHLGPIPQLNELEYIDGKIYANVYQTNVVVAIDPDTGKVLELIRCDDLIRQGRGSGAELNGIAQNDKDGKIYMTGKNWSRLFEVSFVPAFP